MNVLILAHGPEITPGWLTEALEATGATHEVADLSIGQPVPTGGWDKIVVLGGHMGAYEDGDNPWLEVEKAFIDHQLADGTPLLGVCLGSQLIADVIGGRAYRGATTEAGLISLERTPAGAADATLGAIGGPVVAWHHDTFDLPPDAELLAYTSDYPHAFRYGSALGVQFHPEVTPDMWRDWIAMAGPDELQDAGLDPDSFGQEIIAQAPRLRRQAVAFFRSWLEE